MTLVDRYVYAVGKLLPKRNREDIEQEITSLIWDRVDEMVHGGLTEEEAIEETLSELGRPEKMAGEYNQGINYLIGPSLFHIYKMVIGITVFAIILGLTVARVINTIFLAPEEVKLLSILFSYVGQIFQASVTSIGVITLIFYGIQRSMGDELEVEAESTWHPEKLPDVPLAPARISYPEIIANIVFTAVALALFNFYLGRVGVFFDPEASQTVFLRLNMDVFKTYLVYWNFLWVTTILVNIIVLAIQRHPLVMRLLEKVISIAGIIVFYRFVTEPDVLLPGSLSWAQPEWLQYTGIAIRVFIGFVLVVTIVEMIQQVVKFTRYKG